ncbi:MAG: hypothetical protein HKP30_02865, partial [Myxococcales bacterium]|nr:hypothetical protein [Myxococcales bacterium]
TGVLDALDVLVAEGMVQLEAPEAESGPTPGTNAAGRALRLGVDALAAALPLALLLGWFALAGPVAAPEGAPFEIHRDPLASARAAYDVEQLRAAVEAHRFAEGRWPERLGELAARGYVPDDALTDAKGRPYYYAAREDGFVLLAPER